MTSVMKVYAADPVVMAEQCRHYAVRTALRHIIDGEPVAALEVLTKSSKRCANLDHRPLDPQRVQERVDKLVASLGRSR